jgi:hypothetical protein
MTSNRTPDILVTVAAYVVGGFALLLAACVAWLCLCVLVLIASAVAPLYWCYWAARLAKRNPCLGGANGEHRMQNPRQAFHRWLRAVICCVLIPPILYVVSYLALGRHSTGIEFDWSGPTSKEYTYHDRSFPFDPWIYKPLAQLEYRISGMRSQVVIQDGSYRGGQPIYGYGE